MSQTEAAWMLFLGPVGMLAAGAFVHWITGRQDRAELRDARKRMGSSSGSL